MVNTVPGIQSGEYMTLTNMLNAGAFLTFVVGSTPCPGAANAGSPGQVINVENGIVFVDVTVNGRGPFRMLVDTGADSCLLAPAAARKAGLVYDHRTVLATLGGESIKEAASKNLVEVGGRKESNVDIIATEVPHFQTLNSRADGVLGRSFLSRAPYLIDYRRKRIWLGEEATQQAERLPITVTPVHARGRTVLPVVLESGGATWRLTLDSGASHMVVECQQKCPHAGQARSDQRLITHVGEQPVSLRTLKHVQVGGMVMPEIVAIFANAAPPDDQDEGVLPTQWFSAVYVDNLTVRLASAR
jgi:predicted aspartyl protease